MPKLPALQPDRGIQIDLPRPRHLVVPQGIVSDGYAPVAAVLKALRIPMDAWQADAARLANGLTADGLYAAQVAAFSAPRQGGKTYLVYMALAIADCIVNPGTFVVWTAHHSSLATQTALEVLSELSKPKYARYINQRSGLKRATGREEVQFRNGSRMVFRSRDRGALRGFPKVRKLILDEAQIIGESVMVDLVPTLTAATNPQLIMLGTPPGAGDNGEVFTDIRAAAISGQSTDTLYVEYSAPDDLSIDDPEAWRHASPSLACGRTSDRAIHLQRKVLETDEKFAREALGMWSRADDGDVITAATWALAQDTDSVAVSNLVLGVDVGVNADTAALVLAGTRTDGRHHIELVEQRAGVSWVAPFTASVLAANPDIKAVMLDVGSAATVLIDSLRVAGIKTTPLTVRDIGAASVNLANGLADGSVLHTGQAQMSLARGGARKRPLGDTGLWSWSRKSSVTDITPIVAATMALAGSQTTSKVIRPTSNGKKKGRVIVL